MNDIDFSIIFNSRARVKMLTRMLECIQENTHDISKVEVIVNFDDDDNESLSSLPDLNTRFKFFNGIVNKREQNIHVNVNKMAFMAKGKYIWALGDDCHIITKHWDAIAKNKFEQAYTLRSDGVWLGAVESTSVDKCLHYGWYCDAPILTKDGRDKLGYLIHPHFISVGADVATWTVYASVRRIIDLREIVFDHVTHNSFEACNTKDQTQLEYLERQMSNQVFNPFTFDYSEYINQIKSVIHE
jgi:hypothetical protein